MTKAEENSHNSIDRELLELEEQDRMSMMDRSKSNILKINYQDDVTPTLSVVNSSHEELEHSVFDAHCEA